MNHIGTREIATERLTLRRFEIEDAENMFYNWANDPEVTKYLTWPAHESVDTTETILKEWISKYDIVVNLLPLYRFELRIIIKTGKLQPRLTSLIFN